MVLCYNNEQSTVNNSVLAVNVVGGKFRVEGMRDIGLGRKVVI